MTHQQFDLKYDGYWRDENKGGIPAESGVYSVYACSYDKNNKSVSLRKLIYIGESANVRDRIATHEKYEDWKNHLQTGEQLCFNFAPVASTSRERVEAALIFEHKPPENVEYKKHFPYDDTTVTTTAKNALLKPKFTVRRTDP